MSISVIDLGESDLLLVRKPSRSGWARPSTGRKPIAAEKRCSVRAPVSQHRIAAALTLPLIRGRDIDNRTEHGTAGSATVTGTAQSALRR